MAASETGTQTDLVVPAAGKPDIAWAEKAAKSALNMVNSFTIESDEDYVMAGEELAAVKGKIKRIEEQRTAISGPIDKGLKALNAFFRGPREALEAIEKAWKDKILAYDSVKDAKKNAAQSSAESAIEAERQKKRNEADRIEADAKTQANELVRQGKNVEAKQVLDDAAAQAAGLRQLADVMTAQAVVAPDTKVSGMHTTESVSYEVEDLHLFIKHVATRVDLKHLLVVDSIRMRAYVKSMGKDHKVPGIKIFTTKGIASKSS